MRGVFYSLNNYTKSQMQINYVLISHRMPPCKIHCYVNILICKEAKGFKVHMPILHSKVQQVKH